MDQASGQGAAAGRVKNIVLMENISSAEYFLRKGGEPRRVLADINLRINRAEAWGINGRHLFEIKLLLEIMANIRPYDGGRCVLMERGMLRHKRIILRHVFYIGSSEMLYNNMNVLEFLMFAAARLESDPVALQERIFEFIIAIGLGHISLTPNRLLTKEEKAVVTLISAACSDCGMIVFNLPEYEFDGALTGAISKISEFIRSKGKALILGTQNCLLIERACSHTAFIADGGIIYRGAVEDLRMNYDRIAVIIRDKDIYGMLDKLALLFPGHKLSIKGDSLMIGGCAGEQCDPGFIFKKIAGAGFVPDHMEVNPKTVQNAYEELVLRHDLQK
jgi:ABC-2 type transport system ATP-binding protein